MLLRRKLELLRHKSVGEGFFNLTAIATLIEQPYHNTLTIPRGSWSSFTDLLAAMYGGDLSVA